MAYFTTLYSGSSGNCALIRSEDKYLLIDMGKSCRTTLTALKSLGLAVSDCVGIRPRLRTGYLFEKAPRPAVRMCRYAGYAGLPRHDSARGGGNPRGRSDAGNRQLHGDELSHQP